MKLTLTFIGGQFPAAYMEVYALFNNTGDDDLGISRDTEADFHKFTTILVADSQGHYISQYHRWDDPDGVERPEEYVHVRAAGGSLIVQCSYDEFRNQHLHLMHVLSEYHGVSRPLKNNPK